MELAARTWSTTLPSKTREPAISRHGLRPWAREARFSPHPPHARRAVFPGSRPAGGCSAPGPGAADDTLAGPAIKAAALPLGPGISIALSAWGGWSLGLHRLEAAGASIPLTVELGSGVTLNLNAGWEWSRTGDRHKAIVGAQIDWSVSEHLSLMAEGFGQIGAGAGYQAGIRWMPARWIDVDLLVGRLSDGTARHAATMGVTVRY